VLEVVSTPYRDDTVIWADEAFPARVKVKAVVALAPETAVPVQQLKDQLSILENLASPISWTGHARGSPARWKPADSKKVVQALLDAQENPVALPVAAAKLARRPKALRTRIGSSTVSVTVPDREQAGDEPIAPQPTSETALTDARAQAASSEAQREARTHDEIQWLLLKLGSDRGREVNGHKFADMPRLKADLPLQFDEATKVKCPNVEGVCRHSSTLLRIYERATDEQKTIILQGLVGVVEMPSKSEGTCEIMLYPEVPCDLADSAYPREGRLEICSEKGAGQWAVSIFPEFVRLLADIPSGGRRRHNARSCSQ
jgi:hypothetical protein